MTLRINTPRWAKPLLYPMRYKGAKGGRGSGKSHFFAEMLVEQLIINKDLSAVCIREIQKSLKFSAKKLIETKIHTLGVSHLFTITINEIRRHGGDGVIIFQGMQDHTADSIKSLEGFQIAWCEEAQSLSARSLELLLPTIRNDGSEIWFSWNPNQDTDPVDRLMVRSTDNDSVFVHVNYDENPFCPETLKKEAEKHRLRDPESYGHVWLGEYNTKSDDQVLCGKYAIEEVSIGVGYDGPYFGADWGFSVDPNTLIECYIHDEVLYIYREAYGVGIEINDTPYFFDTIDGARKHAIRCDSARPEMVSYMKKHGYPKVESVEKWKGSVEDGISLLRSFEKIIIDPSCVHTAEEARLWKYKRDRLTGDILPVLIDKHNHCWDAIRYALAPLIKSNSIDHLLLSAIR